MKTTAALTFLTGLFMMMSSWTDAQVGIGGDSLVPDNSAILELQSDEKGFLPPRMTFDQRNAIPDPAEGLIIYCTNCKNDGSGVLCLFRDGKWNNFNMDCAVPLTPAAGAHIPGETQITWKWIASPIALGYKWCTQNEYDSATDLGTATSMTETGLDCSSEYSRFVWAYNACGHSDPVVLTMFTKMCFYCGEILLVEHLASGGVAPVDKTVLYITVSNIPGEETKCWLMQNLGADNKAVSVDDPGEPPAGWYWQFNRKQGYKHDGTARTPNTPWYSTWWLYESSDWFAENDPCSLELGIEWRIPTGTEWYNVYYVAGGWLTWIDAWNSQLNLHAPGCLNEAGNLFARGTRGYYWSSSQCSQPEGAGLGLTFDYEMCHLLVHAKTKGFTIRCVRE